MKKRIAVVGSNNAACLTALTLYKIGDSEIDLEIYYEKEDFKSPFSESISYETSKNIQSALNFNWYENSINATQKLGSLYENWGTKNKSIFCRTLPGKLHMNYTPESLFNQIKDSGLIKTKKHSSVSLEKEIDADYIFDCRDHALHSRDNEKYNFFESPVDRFIVGNKDEVCDHLSYTKITAVDDGWYCTIPNGDKTTYIFAFNSNFLSEEDAPSVFTEMFDIEKMHCEKSANYIAKSIWQDERTIFNGKMLGSYDPLDGSINDFYARVANHAWDYIIRNHITEYTKDFANNFVNFDMMQIHNYTLWHYSYGSMCESPFWENAKKVSNKFIEDIALYRAIEASKIQSFITFSNHEPQYYFQWAQQDFKIWNEANN